MMDLDNKLEMLKSNKGGLKVIHRGYMYTVHKKNYGRIRWRCSQRTLHCKGSITTGSGCEEGVPITNLPHNHLPDVHAAALARLRSFVVSEAEAATFVGVGVKKENPVDIIPLRDEAGFMDFDINNENESLENTEMLEPPHLQSILKPRNMPLQKNSPVQDKVSAAVDSEMCLRWNSHHANMQSSFPALMDQEQYVDVTLAVEGKLLKCHKLILSSCSAFFDEMLKNTSPHQETVIYLHGMEFWQVKALVDFMYKGEVNVDQPKLESLLKAAEELEVKGLAGKSQKPEEEDQDEDIELPTPPATVMKESPVRSTSAESPIIEDAQDEEYFPNPELRRKYQVKKRKRKILIPPDPSYLKHVKLNLKGTKSRPNIKQPKFYSPDYPEYDPDRCISPPKLGTDPVFHIDNIKLEPIDIDQPESPNLYEMNAQIDESLSQSSMGESSKPVNVCDRKPNDDATDIEITSSDNANKMTIETLLDQTGTKSAIIVKCQNTKNVLEVPPPLRAMPTTQTILQKFATTQLTSILKKGEVPSVLKKNNKSMIFRQILPKVTSTVTSTTATSTKTFNQKVTVPKLSNTEPAGTLKIGKKNTGTNKGKLEDLEPGEIRMDEETDEDIIAD